MSNDGTSKVGDSLGDALESLAGKLKRGEMPVADWQERAEGRRLTIAKEDPKRGETDLTFTACEKCDGNGFFIVPQRGHGLTAKACECLSACPKCGGRGEINVERDKRGYSEKCGCHWVSRNFQRLYSSRFPCKFAHATIGNYQPKTESQSAALASVKDCAERWPDSQGLLLCGPVGTGKTHLMVALGMRLVLSRGYRCYYKEWPAVTAKMRRLFESHEPTGPLVEELSEVSVLLIDELGAGVGKDWAHDLLNEVISYRYNNDLPIIATTNLKSKALEHAIGARLFSRICEMTQQVTVAGPDHRTGK